MVLDVVDVLFLQRSFAPAVLQRKLTIGIGFFAMIVVSQHHDSAFLHKSFELYPRTFKFDLMREISRTKSFFTRRSLADWQKHVFQKGKKNFFLQHAPR